MYALELAALLCLVSLYRLGDRALLAALDTNPGRACIASGVAAVCCLGFAALRARRGVIGQHVLAGTVAVNLAGAALSLASAEAAIRILSVATPEGPVFF